MHIRFLLTTRIVLSRAPADTTDSIRTLKENTQRKSRDDIYELRQTNTPRLLITSPRRRILYCNENSICPVKKTSAQQIGSSSSTREKNHLDG